MQKTRQISDHSRNLSTAAMVCSSNLLMKKNTFEFQAGTLTCTRTSVHAVSDLGLAGGVSAVVPCFTVHADLSEPAKRNKALCRSPRAGDV